MLIKVPLQTSYKRCTHRSGMVSSKLKKVYCFAAHDSFKLPLHYGPSAFWNILLSIHWEEKKREPKFLSWKSHLVVCNSALYGAPFWCHPLQTWLWREKRPSRTKESQFSKLLSKRAILALLFSQCKDKWHNRQESNKLVRGCASRSLDLDLTLIIMFIKQYP